MLTTLLLCLTLSSHERELRFDSAIGADVLTGGEAPWIGEETTTWRLGAQRHLFAFIGDVWLAGGLSLRPGATEISTTLTLLDAGVLVELPSGGFFGRLFPYARAALEGIWVHVDVGDSYRGDAFSAGLQLGAGLRLQPSPTGRFFLSADASYSRRLATRVKLENTEEDALQAVPTPLGELELSGWALRAGLGWAF